MDHAAGAPLRAQEGVQEQCGLVGRTGPHRVDRADPHGVFLAGRHSGHQQDDLGGVGGDGGVGDRSRVLDYGDLEKRKFSIEYLNNR